MAIPGMPRPFNRSLDDSLEIMLYRAEKHYGYTREEIFGRGRPRPLSWIRQVIHFVLYDEFGSRPTIVGRMTNKDHATVLHSYKMIKHALAIKDTAIVGVYNAIRKDISPVRVKYNGPSNVLQTGREYVKISDPDWMGFYTVMDDQRKPRRIKDTNVDESKKATRSECVLDGE